jgi:hypothetical protein
MTKIAVPGLEGVTRQGSAPAEIIAIYQAQPAQLEPYRPEIRRLNYWLQPDHFDRKTLNQHLQQQAAGTYAWPQPDKEVDSCHSK